MLERNQSDLSIVPQTICLQSCTSAWLLLLTIPIPLYIRVSLIPVNLLHWNQWRFLIYHIQKWIYSLNHNFRLKAYKNWMYIHICCILTKIHNPINLNLFWMIPLYIGLNTKIFVFKTFFPYYVLGWYGGGGDGRSVFFTCGYSNPHEWPSLSSWGYALILRDCNLSYLGG